MVYGDRESWIATTVFLLLTPIWQLQRNTNHRVRGLNTIQCKSVMTQLCFVFVFLASEGVSDDSASLVQLVVRSPVAMVIPLPQAKLRPQA